MMTSVPDGITATGSPEAGTIRKNGRVGMTQPCMCKPLKYRKFISVVTSSAARPCLDIRCWARRVRSRYSASVKGGRSGQFMRLRSFAHGGNSITAPGKRHDVHPALLSPGAIGAGGVGEMHQNLVPPSSVT
jgi:hypothetical protein